MNPSHAALTLFFALLTGCASTVIGRPELIIGGDSEHTKSLVSAPAEQRVQGRSCRHMLGPLVMFFGIDGTPSLDEALAAALATSTGSNALADSKIENFTTYAGLYLKQCIVVEGVPAQI